MTAGVRPAHLLVFVAIMMIWGANFAIAKIGIQQLPPIFLMTLRFGLVALVTLPFVGRPSGHWRQVALISFVLGFLHFTLMIVGLVHVDAATAALAIQLQVPFAAMLAAVLFGDRFGWRRTLGLVVAFLGVGLIAGEPRLEGHYGSLALVVAAALVWATASILVKLLEGVDGLTLNAWVAALATPQLALASLLLEEGQWAALAIADWRAYGSILYQALIVFVIAYGAWYRLLRRYPVNQTMPFTLLVPFFGVASGVVLLDETLSSELILGGLLTVIGVAIIVFRRPQTTAPEAERV